MNVTGKALWYIESHLSGDLSLEAIAAAIGVSRFHLSRVFPVSTGCALSVYVRARRLSEAAKMLAQGAPNILAVALDAGYSSHEAFTRAFNQLFGLTPDQFRAQSQLENFKLMEPLRMNQPTIAPLTAPRIVQGDALLIFGIARRYSCASKAGIPSQWDAFLPHFCHIPAQIGRVAYGVVSHTDDTGDFDYTCGVQVAGFPAQPHEFVRMRIPPQTYAVFKHKEHISSIAATLDAIWNQGLADSGHQAADGPMFERYGEEFDGRTGLGGLEIWVPVKA